MSILIDELVAKANKNQITEGIDIGDGNGTKWYIAKSLSGPLGLIKLYERFQDAFRIIIGKSFACHYKRDEL